MERKNNPIFDEVIQACEAKGIKALMGFKQHWNKELIAQFYATVYFGYVPKEDGWSDRAMFWMTEGESHHLSFSNFSLYSGYLMMGLLGFSMMRVRLRQKGWLLCIPEMQGTVGDT
jgi:hypothetical protein